MDESPKRRRLQFGLRSLLISMAVLAPGLAWLSYELNWVRQRHEALRSEDVSAGDGPHHKPGVDPAAPGVLWLFGEGAYEYILVSTSADGQLSPAEKARLAQVSRLFPEAIVEPQWLPERALR